MRLTVEIAKVATFDNVVFESLKLNQFILRESDFSSLSS
jgi:hypothetical protein